MKCIETTQAAGHVLCHDITVIVKDVKKGVAFKKGHVVTEADIPELLKLGKDHLYVWEKDDTMLHENEAAEILYTICKGENMHGTEPKEGKIELVADCDGLLTIDSERLYAVNDIEELMIATRHGNTPVKKGDKLAGTRVIPLVIQKEKMESARKAAGDEPLMNVLPYKRMRCGIVTTGNEVFYGRIKDTFTPVIEQKVAEYGIEVMGHETCPDDQEKITAAINRLLQQGAELILTTGGMSVDPDDRTPSAIRATGATVVTYGAPVLPGAMMLLAYTKDGVPILGLPGCVMYAKRTVFDLVLPRIAAGQKLERRDIVAFGEGGLCLSCPTCTYPNCGFGK
ncbi:molybdopterin-binding protein [Beduinella massiliensis]|uniref:molybdopterin-binding protein n=1 Tax=Beduinella massiliensis TaxID=1852363 RepID=UPI000C8288D8